jgi:hypothetical protein
MVLVPYAVAVAPLSLNFLGGKKTRDRQAKQLSEKGVRMDTDRKNFGRSFLKVVTECDTQCTPRMRGSINIF